MARNRALEEVVKASLRKPIVADRDRGVLGWGTRLSSRGGGAGAIAIAGIPGVSCMPM